MIVGSQGSNSSNWLVIFQVLTALGRLTEGEWGDMRGKAAKLFLVSDTVSIDFLEPCVDLFKQLFRSAGMSDKITSADLSEQLLHGVLSSVRVKPQVCLNKTSHGTG